MSDQHTLHSNGFVELPHLTEEEIAIVATATEHTFFLVYAFQHGTRIIAEFYADQLCWCHEQFESEEQAREFFQLDIQACKIYYSQAMQPGQPD